jgi:hypothetical protein
MGIAQAERRRRSQTILIPLWQCHQAVALAWTICIVWPLKIALFVSLTSRPKRKPGARSLLSYRKNWKGQAECVLQNQEETAQ